MAAALAASMFARENINVAVSSAGVSAFAGSSASKNAILAMELEKLDLTAHKSQSVLPELLENTALVLPMTRTHLSHVKAACPKANAYTLGEFAGSLMDISDPFGGNLDEYKTCAAQIKKLLEACLDRFKEGQGVFCGK
jgi:protein-tyrosine-phosphatase